MKEKLRKAVWKAEWEREEYQTARRYIYVVHSWNFYTRPQQISKTNKDRRHTSSFTLAVNELLRNSKTAIWWLKIRSLRLKRPWRLLAGVVVTFKSGRTKTRYRNYDSIVLSGVAANRKRY